MADAPEQTSSPSRRGKAPLPTHILCVRCGYDVDDAVRQGKGEACPECGLACEASDPARRGGSTLERAGVKSGRLRRLMPSAEGYVRGVWAMLRGPGAELRAMRAERLLAMRLWNVVVACVVAGGGGWMIEAWIVRPSRDTYIWALAGMWTLVLCPTLTGMESVGMRVLSRLRGWRLTKRNAQAIADHASTAWVFGAAVGVVVGVAYAVLIEQLPEVASRAWYGDPSAVIVLPALLGLVTGLLWFEWLCWLGLRERKFAADCEERRNRH